MSLRVRIENHARIQQILGIDQVLKPLHCSIGFTAPFRFNEGSHIAACAMFCLERTLVFCENEMHQVIDEMAVTPDFPFCVEALRKDEVEISILGMPEDNRVVVSVLYEQSPQVCCSVRQVANWKGNIFDDDCGSGGSSRTHGGEQPFANTPQLFPLK